MKKVKLLIVDDSALVRQILTQGLSRDPEIEVVGVASDPYVARDKIVNLKPDVLTLDVEMPRMDGVEFLRRLMPQHPLPVLMVSSLTERGKQITVEALEAGAVDFVTKPSSNVNRDLHRMISELQYKIKAVSKANVSSWKNAKFKPRKIKSNAIAALAQSTDKVIAIGASTGGTEALKLIIQHLPADTPGVVIVQHMPPGFTGMFAERLNQQSSLNVKEAKTGDRVMQGTVLVAPGGFHMTVIRSGGQYRVDISEGEKVCGHRPSVEMLFKSVAKSVGSNALGVILTGMGHDGADGLLEIRKAGALTIAQDEKTSVVFGMPKVAIEKGAACDVVPIDRIAERIISMLAENVK